MFYLFCVVYSQWSTKLSIRLARIIYFSEDLLHTRSIKWIVHIDYRMRSSIDALIVVTLILLMWWNCLSHDIIGLKFSKILNCLLTNCRRSYSRKIVWIDHFSEDSLRWCSVECNVHINSRICKSINALIVVAMILLTWPNCSSHRIIDLVLQEFNVYIHVFITFKTSFRFIIYVIVCTLRELIANQFLYQLQWFRSQVSRIDLHSSSKYRDSKRWAIFSSRSVCFKVFGF